MIVGVGAASDFLVAMTRVVSSVGVLQTSTALRARAASFATRSSCFFRFFFLAGRHSGTSQSTSSTSSLNPSRPEHVAEYNQLVDEAAASDPLAATARWLGKLTPTEPSAIHAPSSGVR